MIPKIPPSRTMSNAEPSGVRLQVQVLEVRASTLQAGTLQGKEFENAPDDAGRQGHEAKEDGSV